MLDLSGYKLTFDDEFNSLSVSATGTNTKYADLRSEWKRNAYSDIGFGASSFVDAGSGYNPFSVANGALTITASPDTSKSAYAGAWQSGLLNTKSSFSQTYGYFEIRADFSDSPGAWDAFWLLPEAPKAQTAKGWQELDVVEHLGSANAIDWSYIHTTQSSTIDATSTNPATVTGYHTYGMDWEKDTIKFYVDGKLTATRATPSDMNGPMYLLADLAAKKLAISTSTPMSTKIDYIRVYSNDPSSTAVAQDTVSSPDGTDPGMYGATSLVQPKITEQLDATGRVKSRLTTWSDGSSDLTTYNAGVIASDVFTYKPSSADLTDSKLYTKGLLTNETVAHADGSKDVTLSGLQGQVYSSEHDTYGATGLLTAVTRTRSDGTQAYTYSLSADGAKTTQRFDPAGVIASQTTAAPDGSSDAKTYVGGAIAIDVFTYAPGSADISDTKLYSAGALAREAVIHADKSKDVYISGAQNLIVEHDVYNTAGLLTSAVRTRADGSLQSTLSVSPDGVKTADQYDLNGLVSSHAVTSPDGSSHTTLFSAGVMTSDVTRFATGAADLSETKNYSGGLLTRDVVVHADGTKDVQISVVGNPGYAKEHDVYNAAGTLTSAIRTRADGLQSFVYTLASDGTKTTDQFGAAGATASHMISWADGSSRIQTFGADNKILSDVFKYAPGGHDASVSKQYSDGLLTRDVVIHTDMSKDVYAAAGSSQLQHTTYDTSGHLMASQMLNQPLTALG